MDGLWLQCFLGINKIYFTVESYAESAQATGASLKMEIPEYIDCGEAINTSNANNTTYIQG